MNNYPHLKGKVTDLLIGDLFTDKVDVVWEPLESLYSVDKNTSKRWDSGTPPEVAATKLNELFLPDGPKP